MGILENFKIIKNQAAKIEELEDLIDEMSSYFPFCVNCDSKIIISGIHVNRCANLINDSYCTKKGLENIAQMWKENETLKILLRNTIDAYEDECDMNSAEHFVEKLKEETGITNEEYNKLFKGDKQVLEDGSVITCKEE